MLTPAKAQDNIMKDEIRKIIHHEISQKKCCEIFSNLCPSRFIW
jgi:hypothetical protein